MNSLQPPLTAPNSSADVFSKDLVPVQHTDYSALPFLKPSSTQHSGDGDKSTITKASHLGTSPMQINSPLVSSEAAYFNTFVPVEFKSDQVSRDSSAYEDSHDYGRDVSADTRSSLDGKYFAYDEQIANEKKRRKKVGRPIAYKGDPNASNLTEAERRRIKRRIANRESARRVRARRQGTLEELQVRMNYISAHNSEMVKHIAEVEGHTALLKGQLQQTELYWNRALADNARLHQQMAVLTARPEGQAPVQVEQKSAEEAAFPACPMAKAGSYNAAPVTGIRCSLIDELPTMALPMPEMMNGSALEGFDQEFSDYLM